MEQASKRLKMIASYLEENSQVIASKDFFKIEAAEYKIDYWMKYTGPNVKIGNDKFMIYNKSVYGIKVAPSRIGLVTRTKAGKFEKTVIKYKENQKGVYHLLVLFARGLFKSVTPKGEEKDQKYTLDLGL